MATLEALNSIRSPLITISKILGAEIWTSNQLFQPASYYLMANMVIYNICTVYTVATRATDPVKIMQITIIFGIASQLIFKFFYQLSKKNAIRDVFDLAEENIYRRYSITAKAENIIIEKTVRYLGIIWKTMAVLYTSTLFVFGMWPVYVYYTKGQLVTLFMYEIPMVDTGNSIGYLLTLFLHVDIYVLGVFGSIMADYTFIFLVFHSMASIDLFIVHATELTCLLAAENPVKNLNEIADKWKCCIQDHQFAMGFLNTTESITGILCLVQVFSCVFSICDAMLLVALTDWYAAFCFLIVIFGEISIYFVTGHLVDLKVDAMYKAITNLPWNLLDVSQQKQYRYLLARSQRPLILTLYGFAPLNFESYMTVLRALYQFFVMIMQYIG